MENISDDVIVGRCLAILKGIFGSSAVPQVGTEARLGSLAALQSRLQFSTARLQHTAVWNVDLLLVGQGSWEEGV